MSKEKHGILGSIIKFAMVTVFTLIGIALIVVNSICLSKGESHYDPKYKWVVICNLVFGCLLLTSPFFLNKKREGLWKIVKVLMIIIFVAIGIILITGGSMALAKNLHEEKAASICSVVFGCLLFTSPYFLKK